MKHANVRATRTRHVGPAYVDRNELANWLNDRIREHTTYKADDYVIRRERTIYIQCLAYLTQMEIHA